jgi:hypothetical protein
MKRLLTIISAVVLALAAGGMASAQSDPRIGTWKLNVAKSTSDGPPRKSEMRTYTASADGITMHTDVVAGDGSKQTYGYTGKTDGKDYSYTGQQPAGAETVSLKRVGNTVVSESKKGGKVLFTSTASLSSYGKVMTITTKGTDAKGQSANSVRVYDKQ